MRSRLALLASVSAVGVVMLGASVASAQDAPADPAPAPVDAPAAAPAPAPAASGGDKDGVRFRGGISGGVGAEIVSGSTAIMGGVDGRMGVQINDLIGVYAQPHLSFGSFGGGGFAGGATGTFAGSAVVDFTFIDHLFAGAGAGFGVLNNPTGPLIHFRAGGYPLMGEGDDGIRRKGLMLAFDMRVFFLDGATAVFPMGSIGYEAF